MKKSNKLLLGGFLTVILLITGIHIALFAKYKNGNYSIYQPEDKMADNRLQSFPAVSYVMFRNVRGATIQFSDKASVEKDKEDVIQYVQKGDSLVITGQSFYGNNDGRHLVYVTVPGNVTLSAVNSVLRFESHKQDMKNNIVINLHKSHAIFFESVTPFVLGNVKVTASDSSVAAFHGDTKVDHLEAQLSNSALEYNEGDAGQMFIVTDSLSRLSLSSRQFLKAKITTAPNNP